MAVDGCADGPVQGLQHLTLGQMESQAPSERPASCSNWHPGALAPALAQLTLRAAQSRRPTSLAQRGKCAQLKGRSWKTPTATSVLQLPPHFHLCRDRSREHTIFIFLQYLYIFPSLSALKSQQQMGKYEQPSSELEDASANGRFQTVNDSINARNSLRSDLTRYTKKPQLFSYP